MTHWPELFILRHGQTVWNAEGRHQGRKDSPLTALGRDQAKAQRQILRAALPDWDTVRCYASPIGRAWTTAEIALEGQSFAPDDRLVEVFFGRWEGLTRAEIDARWPHHAADAGMMSWHLSSVGGERLPELQARARSFLDQLTGPAVVVTHGITSRVLRGLWLGLDQHGMSDLPGGQGVVYHLKDGRHRRLTDEG